MQKRQTLCRLPEPNHVLNSLPPVAGTLRGKTASRPLARRYMLRTVSVVFFFMFPSALYACSCGGSSFEDAIARADNIFVARIYTIEDRLKSPGAFEHERGIRARFELLLNYKGNIQEYEFLYSGYGGGDCGYPLKVGPPYLLMTSKNHVHICTHNIEYYIPNHRKFREKHQTIKSIVSDI
jgi:hypothetical protein